MAWCRIQLTEDERRIVNEERAIHPNLLVRNRLLTIWLLHCGVTRQKAAEIVGVSALPCSDTWTRTAKADWTGCGIRASQSPSPSWPPSVLLTFKIFEACADFLTPDGLGSCRKRRNVGAHRSLVHHAVAAQPRQDIIRASNEEAPVCTIAEACDRIEKLTGIRRSRTQVGRLLKGLGLKWQRIRAIPVPPKKTWPSTLKTKPSFSTPS